MAVKIKTVAETVTQQGVKALVYGKAGSGKTRLCGTAPEPIILSAEAGLLSLQSVNPNLHTIEISSILDLSEAFQWATESEEAKRYHTVCLDSISEIAEQILSNAKAQVNDPRQAYGELIEQMTRTLKGFRDLKRKHVLMTCKQQRVQDTATGVTSFLPSMPGTKLEQDIPFLFDEVFHMDVGTDPETNQPVRYLQTAPDFQFEAKDRSGALDPVEAPDFTAVVNKILAAGKKAD